MDRRLEAAAHAGDVGALRQLLEEDKLLLHRPQTAAAHYYPIDNPLHIAASLGHFEFTREILTLNPSLARSVNGQGLSPLHLASANGQLMVVKELLSVVGSDLCLLHDKNGLIPIHSAAMNGKVDVLEELMKASPESVRVRTCQGDNVLHLAVKSNYFQAVKLLVERLEEDGEEIELLMSGDARGNTILHLATARKQYEILKLLLNKPWADVNASNIQGLTIFNVFMESPYEHGDLMLGEMIRAAGGRLSGLEGGDQIHHDQSSVLRARSSGESSNNFVRIKQKQYHTRNMPIWRRVLIFIFKYPLDFVGLGYLVGVEDRNPEDYYRTAPDTLLIVATLIATVTFQGGLNPPGGFVTRDDVGKTITLLQGGESSQLVAGQALISGNLDLFIATDAIALLASLTVILVLVSPVPKWKSVIRILMWVTWIAFFFMGIAFKVSIFSNFPDINDDFDEPWSIIVCIFIIWVCIMCIAYLFKKGHWVKDRKLILVGSVEGHEKKAVLYLRRFLAGIGIIIVMVATAGGIIFMLPEVIP